MPLNYLAGSEGNLWSLGNLGNQYADAVMNMQNARLRGMQWQQQQALEAARLRQQGAYQRDMLQQGQQQMDFERQKWQQGEAARAAEMALRQAEADRYKSMTEQTQQESAAGGKLGMLTGDLYQTDPTRNPDTYAFLRGLMAQQQARLAATAPGTIVRQMNELTAARDPRMQQLMATGTPMYQNVGAGQTLMDMSSSVPMPVYSSPFRPSTGMSYEDRANLERMRAVGASATKNFFSPEETLRAMQGVDGSDSYATERAARAAGKRAGDVIHIQGVGTVRLK